MARKDTDWTYASVLERGEQFLAQDEDEARRAKRRRIVAAATELIAAHGYRKVSVDEIARRAHVAKGTVYLYYKNKAELLVHAIAEEKMRYLLHLKPVLDGALDPRERIKGFMRLTLTLAKEMPMLSKLLQGDREVLLVLEEMDASLRDEMIGQREAFLGHLIREAAGPGALSEDEANDRARLMAALIYSGGAFFDERIRHGLSIERFAELLADVVVDGLVTPPAEIRNVERESA